MSLILFKLLSWTIILIFIFYLSYRYKSFYVFNFIIGFIFIILCCDYYFNEGLFEKKTEFYKGASSGAVLIYVFNISFYLILSSSVPLILLLFKENEDIKRYYFTIPIIVYLVIINIFIIYTDFPLIFFVIIFLSFFPLYTYSYYLKFMKNKK